MNTSSCISKVLRGGIIASSLFLAVSYTSVANAAQGCGHGYHRMHGMCVLNHPGPYARPAPYHPGCWRNAWGQLRCHRYR